MIESKSQAIELLIKALPYPEQITNFDLDKEDSIYFDWRKVRYKLEYKFVSVWRVDNGCLVGCDTSILMSHLLKVALINKVTK